MFMKNANLFRVLLLSVSACLAVSCNDTPESPEIPDDPNKPDVPVVVEADFKFSVETVTSNSAVVVVEPKSLGDYYTWDVVESEVFDKTYDDDEMLIAEHQNYLNRQLEVYRAEVDASGTITDLLTRGTDRQRIAGLKPAAKYTAFAFGMDETGKSTTAPVKFVFETKPFEVADNCSFGIEFSNVEQLRFAFTVTPTDNSTRYYIGITDGDMLKGSTPEQIADDFIKRAEIAGIEWSANDALRTGAVTIDTVKDLEIYSLEPATEYSIVVFGVSNQGERTTAVFHKEVTTLAVPDSEMTIQLEIVETSVEGAKIKVTPSADETYMAGCMLRSDFEKYTNEREFMEYVVEVGNIELYSGEQIIDKTGRLLSDKEYVCFAFGYVGGISTGLFHTYFKTDAPKTESPALVEMSEPYGKANSMCDVAVYVDLKPNEYAEKWYAGVFYTVGGVVDGLSDAQIITRLTTEAYKDNYYWNTVYAAGRGTFGREMTFFAIARDKDGNLGALVKKTVVPTADLLPKE